MTPQQKFEIWAKEKEIAADQRLKALNDIEMLMTFSMPVDMLKREIAATLAECQNGIKTRIARLNESMTK